MSEVTKPKTLSPKKINEILKACEETKALGTELYNRLEKREKELAELREWKADVEDSHKRVMSEQCPTDEQHCTCVPILRAELAEVKEALASWQNEAIQSRATIKLLTESTKELSALQAQIKQGELVPVGIADDYRWKIMERYPFVEFGGVPSLKQFTAEKAKEANSGNETDEGFFELEKK